MNLLKNLSVFVWTLTSLLSAHAAGNAENSVITGVDVRSSGAFLITVSPAIVGSPTCASVAKNRMTGNLNTAGGKALLQAAMTAYVTGQKVFNVQGTGTCDEFTGFESMSLIALGQGI